MHVAVLDKPNFEADDILATLASRARAQGMEVLVCTGDRDALQLVNDDVTVLYPVKGVSELARMTPAAVETKYGVPPHRYPDLAALVGSPATTCPVSPASGPRRPPSGSPPTTASRGPGLRCVGPRQGRRVPARPPGPGRHQPPS
ncbi:5'-3' exonuclease [Cellulomonas soli]